MRRLRARRAAGNYVLRVEVDLGHLADLLVADQLLPAWDTEDPEAVARAVEKLLASMASLQA
jgi:hypothetical protein